jgi:hypothetical protein
MVCTFEAPYLPMGGADLEGTTSASGSCDLGMFIELTGRELYNYSHETVIELLHELKKEKSKFTGKKMHFQDVASGDESVLCWMTKTHEVEKALACLRQRRY